MIRSHRRVYILIFNRFVVVRYDGSGTGLMFHGQRSDGKVTWPELKNIHLGVNDYFVYSVTSYSNSVLMHLLDSLSLHFH